MQIKKIDIKGGQKGICAHQDTCDIPKLGQCDYRACADKELTLYNQLYVHYTDGTIISLLVNSNGKCHGTPYRGANACKK